MQLPSSANWAASSPGGAWAGPMLRREPCWGRAVNAGPAYASPSFCTSRRRSLDAMVQVSECEGRIPGPQRAAGAAAGPRAAPAASSTLPERGGDAPAAGELPGQPCELGAWRPPQPWRRRLGAYRHSDRPCGNGAPPGGPRPGAGAPPRRGLRLCHCSASLAAALLLTAGRLQVPPVPGGGPPCAHREGAGAHHLPHEAVGHRRRARQVQVLVRPRQHGRRVLHFGLTLQLQGVQRQWAADSGGLGTRSRALGSMATEAGCFGGKGESAAGRRQQTMGMGIAQLTSQEVAALMEGGRMQRRRATAGSRAALACSCAGQAAWAQHEPAATWQRRQRCDQRKPHSSVYLTVHAYCLFSLQVLPAQAAQGEEGQRPDPGDQRGQ